MKLSWHIRYRFTFFLKEVQTKASTPSLQLVKKTIDIILNEERESIQKAIQILENEHNVPTKDNLEAIWLLGVCYCRGIGVLKDEKRGVKFYEPAANQGYAGAQYELGVYYENGKCVPKNLDKAVRLFQAAAKQGYPSAQYNLGFCYGTGKGVSKDEKIAAEFYQAAARQGHPYGLFNMGIYYAKGKGVPQDTKRAVELYQAAIEANPRFLAAQNNLAICYAKGRGVPQDLQKAAKLYKASAKRGDASAQYNLGGCYAKGEGVLKNAKKAAALYLASAKQGIARAQFKLGGCYEKGEGVPPNIKKAIKYYRLAHKQGYKGMSYASLRMALNRTGFVSILMGDSIDTMIKKLITTLLYHAKRYTWDVEPCVTLRYLIGVLRGKYKKYNQEQFEKVIQEFETQEKTFFGSHLSDDSDSEDDWAVPRKKNEGEKIQHLIAKAKTLSERQNIQRPKPLGAQVIEDLNKLNKLLSQENTVSEAVGQIKTKFYVAQYRGITYLTTKWNKPSRQMHRQEDETRKPQYSASVLLGAANKTSLLEVNRLRAQATMIQRAEFEVNNQKWAELLKEKVLSIRNTRRYRYGNITYDNLGALLQNVYSQNYDEFEKLLKEGVLLKHFLLNEHIPFVSTGDVPNHALQYAYGIKPYRGHKDERLRPRWQKNGRSERPHSGKVYVSIHPLTDYGKEGPLHMVSENAFGNIQLNNLIISERESTFPAWIEGDRVLIQHVAKYPSFNKPYKSYYLEKYGLSENKYEYFKNMFNAASPHTDAMRRFKEELASHLCAYCEVRLIELARQKVENSESEGGLGGVLIYRDEKGLFSTELPPDTPLRRNKKVDEAQIAYAKEARAFRKQLAKDASETPDIIVTFQEIRKNAEKISPTKYAGQLDLVKAIRTKSLANVKKLQLRGADFITPYFENNDQITTPLHQAVLAQAYDIVEYLLGKGAYTDIRDFNGETPAHIAARLSNKKIIELLVENNANMNILNNTNQSPKDIAPDLTLSMLTKVEMLGLLEKQCEVKRRAELQSVQSTLATVSNLSVPLIFTASMNSNERSLPPCTSSVVAPAGVQMAHSSSNFYVMQD